MISDKISSRGLRRRSLAGVTAVAAAAVVALSACSGGGSGDSGPVSGQTLTYWATLQGTGADQTQKTLTAEFKKFTQQTGVKVKLEVIPWTTLQTRILNAVTSNNGADVMEIGNTWAPSLAASGGFLEFTPKVLDQIGGQSKFVQTSFAENGLPNKTPMSVPVYATSYSLAYNKADFAAAGIAKPPATWDELITDGRKLTTAGRYGIALDGSNATDASHWAFILGEQSGSPLYNSSGKPDFANQKLADALTTYVGLFGRNGIANPANAQNGAQPLSDFAKNKAAMTIGQGVATSLTQLGMDASQFGIAQVPVFSPLPAGGKPIQSHVAGINLVVRQSTEHQKAALELVKFMTSQPEQVAINHIYGTLPVITSAYDDPQFQDDTTKVYREILENHSAPMPLYPSESQMETLLGGAVTSLIAKTASTGTAPSTSAIVSALTDAQKQLIASTGGQ
ncbi:ABC transporter substrate-binding protein [Rugosimonospora africana]|uniref:Sugar ABC transporter substrate-binding protein n=1 Tax=Rugosimonospora africana TaxID=556532 RepID=A0A8J3QSC5_9ACTN|nr:sugar ABC transporter substrate-binding protein [Rugosimonospora africana]GIH15844.1 sugar ABC transporter substrate-binding protein [Rugosimonospora africana]